MAKRWQTANQSWGRRGLGHVDAEVGAKLREYGIRSGLSQIELGAKAGVTFQQIQKYEYGTNAIATARLPSVCEALNISPNDLYGTLYTTGKAREAVPQLSTFATKLALAVDGLSEALTNGDCRSCERFDWQSASGTTVAGCGSYRRTAYPSGE
jgi:transcriptional regulator with XRE-family HTH domain